MSRALLRSSLVLVAMSAPSLAWGHAELLWPPDRANTNCDGGADDECKTGPCGGGTGNTVGNPTVLTQGSSLTVQWQETIEHAGHYELRLSTNGGAVLGDGTNRFTWALNSNLADMTGTIPPGYRQYTYTMTVPTSGACNPCVLQFLQFMMGAASPYYYSCADVAILPEGAPTPTPTNTVTPTPTPPDNSGDPETVHGGCVCDTTAASSARGWFVMAGLALVGLLFARRAVR